MRCAIYTRKSADERMCAEFGSLENQRAFCASRIASQAGLSRAVETRSTERIHPRRICQTQPKERPETRINPA